MLNSYKIKDFAKKQGAHLVGIAPSERFKDAPRGHTPSDLLPGAKSVVVMALRIPLSIVKSIPSVSYSKCYYYLNELLRVLAYRVAALVDDHGFDALPIDPSEPDYVRDVNIAKGEGEPRVKMLASFSHRHAAVMAGLGEISAASYVVVPKYGPRIRFVSTITTAYLEADPMLKEDLTWGLVCKPELCGLACTRACPANALPGDGSVDHFKCRKYRDPQLHTIEYFENIAELERKRIPKVKRGSMFARMYPTVEIQTCGLCVKACPIGIIHE